MNEPKKTAGCDCADQFEKRPLGSKKFVAFLVAEVTWKIIVGMALVMGIVHDKVDVIIGSLLMAVVIIAGFVEAGYIIGQASLDKFTRVAEIATQAGRSFSSKEIMVGAVDQPKGEEPKPSPEQAEEG